MKLSLRFFIPLVGITALSVATPAADMISHSGHARSRLELEKNTGSALGATKTDWTEVWLNRVRLNVDISPSKTLMVRLTPQVAHTFGTTVGGVANPATLSAQEAWMSWTANDTVSLYVGRQVWSYGKGLIIGSNDWGSSAGQAARFFDAAKAHLTFDMGTADVFYAKINETAAVAGTDVADHDLFGLYAQLNPDMGVVKNVDLYALWNDDRGVTTLTHTRDRLATLGLRADGDLNVVDYNAEVSAQFGKTGGTDIKGIQLSAQGGVDVMSAHHVALGLDYANTEFADQFPSTHEQFGKADIITARNNILAISLMSAWRLHDKWNANIDGYYFMAAKDDTTSAGGLTTTSGKRGLGMEADLALAYMAEKNLTFDFGYNLFKGGDALEAAGGDETHSGLFAQGTLTGKDKKKRK